MSVSLLRRDRLGSTESRKYINLLSTSLKFKLVEKSLLLLSLMYFRRSTLNHSRTSCPTTRLVERVVGASSATGVGNDKARMTSRFSRRIAIEACKPTSCTCTYIMIYCVYPLYNLLYYSTCGLMLISFFWNCVKTSARALCS